MVRKPSWSPEMEREGRRYAELHPLERDKVLEACERAGVSIDRNRAEVLIWGDAADVPPHPLWIHRNEDGDWEAKRVVS
jgi:hypothetical protein